MNATFTGVHTHDDSLPDWTRVAREDDVREMRELRHRLETTHPAPRTIGGASRGRPSPPDWVALAADPVALDAELARANLDVRILETESRFFHDRNPALWTGEAIFGVISLLLRPFSPLEQRTGPLLARLDAVPRFLSQMRATLTDPVPAPWIARARRECQAAQRFLRVEIRVWSIHAGMPVGDSMELARAADHAAEAFEQSDRWLAALHDGDDAQDPDIGCSLGADGYDLLLRRGHFAESDAETLLARARAQLPQEQEKLAALVRDIAGSPDALNRLIAASHPGPDEYLSAFGVKWVSCRAFSLQHDLVEWPDWPIRYVPIPEWAREAAPHLYFLFYRSPAPFDPYTVHEYLVTPVDRSVGEDECERRLRACNHSTITLNHVVHHGALGHHVQNWHATHRSRSRIGTIAAVDGASRIGMFLGGSMAEGWACYATELMDELGFLSPLERAAEQQSRVRMLGRAIVDINLHTGAFTFRQAVAYYRDTVAMPADAATGEATKNSMFPGTAVMYWLGSQGILDLRETVRARHLGAFSSRRFHDALLSWGAIPVPVLSRLLTERA